MKRLIATSLLLGYIMLVPFCFYGGIMMANADTMNMIGNPAHQMDDCGLPLGCANGMTANGNDGAAHHLGMYNSITATPLTMLSVLMTLLLVAFALVFSWLRLLTTQIAVYPRTHRRDRPQSSTRQSILTWLSLFETSPNFA